MINYGSTDLYSSYLKDVFWLPHSCDEWVIGDLAKAKAFSDELRALIAKVEAEQ